LVYNAITAAFLYGGIPTIYYGLEQDIADGKADPANREALWLYNDFSTTASPTYARIATLNKVRSTLGKTSAFLNSVAKVAAVQAQDIAWSRPGALIVLTKVGYILISTYFVLLTLGIARRGRCRIMADRQFHFRAQYNSLRVRLSMLSLNILTSRRQPVVVQIHSVRR